MVLRKRNLEEFQELFDFEFNDIEILDRALTTRSYANEMGLSADKHQNAFRILGDAIIDTLIFEVAITKLSIHTRKELDDCRQLIVDGESLNQLGKTMRLEQFINWGRGEYSQEAWKGSDVYGECFEAIIGSLFLDRGLDDARNFFWLIFKVNHHLNIKKKEK